MDTFSQALLSEKTHKIPDEYDWFAPLLGDWDCDYDDNYGGQPRHVKGEWIFRRVLEGTGIQDIFIFPSRATKENAPQPNQSQSAYFFLVVLQVARIKIERCANIFLKPKISDLVSV